MDQAPETTAEPMAENAHETTAETTGVASVDRVLAEVAAVADGPVSEHVQVFERAHEQLRRALDAPPGPVPDVEQGA